MKYNILIITILSIKLIAFEDVNSDGKNEVLDLTEKEVKISSVVDLDSVQKAYFHNDKDAIVVYKYDPEKIKKIRTRILSKTTVILPSNDYPIGHLNGSPAAFKLEFLKDKKTKFDLKNVFTVTPKYVGTDTTLTVFGQSGRIYNFYLYSIGLYDKKVPNSTVFITENGKLPKLQERINLDDKDKKIISLQEEINKYKEKLFIETQKDSASLNKFNIANIQFDYKFKKEFKLEAIFNDEEFTYFKFKDGFDIPKLYYVDQKKDKIYLNFMIHENIIKVKKLAKNWNLALNGEYLDIQKVGSFKKIFSEKKLFADMTKTSFNLESISGDQTISPSIVFNDEEFTYFKFDMQDKFKKFPAVFRVIDGYDNPVAFEIVNDYVVAKIIHDKFTLRLGEKHNCIRIIQ